MQSLEQTAQILAGHSDPRTHGRYVEAATIQALPEAAMLQVEGPIMGVCAGNVHKRPLSGPDEGPLWRFRELT
jgi:hypothetical protein